MPQTATIPDAPGPVPESVGGWRQAQAEPADLHCDVLIIGAGPVGMSLALALLSAGGQRPPKIIVIDQASADARQHDARALALSHGARQLLEPLAAWPQATAITSIHTSQRGGFGRTLMDSRQHQLPALGYVSRYGELCGALQQALEKAMQATANSGSQVLYGCTPVADTALMPAACRLLQQAGQTLRCHARLVVHAEGGKAEDANCQTRDYQQQAVICEVRTARPHHNRAWERFTADGPLALLPLADAYSVVFTLPTHKAGQIMQLDDAAFLAVLQEQFGERHRFTQAGPRHSFPLALRLRRTLVRGNEVWIGNSAQTLHPVSGQGFNLGLRDAWQLAEHLLSDPQAVENLAPYARSRRLDRQAGALFTDQIVRIFSNDFAPLRVLRGLGLLALDTLPPARQFVARRMIWGARAWP